MTSGVHGASRCNCGVVCSVPPLDSSADHVVAGLIEQLLEGWRLDPAEAGKVREVGEEKLDAEPWVGRACHGKYSWAVKLNQSKSSVRPA